MKGHGITTFMNRAIRGHYLVATIEPGKQRGVSLVEVMIVVSIMVILLGTAVPSLQEFIEHRRLEGRALELVTDIHYVRSEAVARNRGVRISFGSDSGGTCYVLHTGDAGDCVCSSAGTAQCSDASSSVIKSVGLATGFGVRLQANVSSMLFDPVHGTTTPTGSINFTTNSGKTIRHVVNILGRTRTCSPDGSVNGYRVC